MTRTAIFGAGGRAGRAAVAEALGRGHEVTAIVRDPARHNDLARDGVTVAQGDVTRGDILAGHDALISAVYAPEPGLYTAAASALVSGSVGRLVVVGLASVLATRSGDLLMDTPGYPQEYRGFYLEHAAGLEVLRSSDRDWLVLSPAGDFDHAAAPTGRYRTAPADANSRTTYADLAVALIDEIDRPKHHRVHLGIESV